MVSPQSSQSRPPRADHIIDSNSTATYFLGGARKDWMSSHPPPQTLPTSSIATTVPGSDQPDVAPASPVTPGQNVQHLDAPVDPTPLPLPLPPKPNSLAIAPPSPNSPESYSSPPVAQAPSNHPTEATVSTTPLRALSTECSAPADTTEALAINASGGAQADQPAHVPAPGPPDQQLLQTIQPAPSPTAQQTHQPTAPLEPESTPSTAVLLPAKTGRNVPKQQSGPHDATLVSVSNGRTEEIPQPSQVPADGMNPHSHTPELTDIGTSARGAIPPEGQINWKQWKQKCNRLDQQTQDDTLRVNSFLVTPRITLLRDAISFNDSFYLVLHQLYCLRSHDESFFLERFPMFRTEEYRRGMDRMQDLLAPNQKLPPAILLQFVKFPDTLDIMMSQPWYNYQVQEVGKFLSRLDQIAPNFRTHFYEFVSDRGYPPLMSEMALLFKVTPLVILSVIYLSTFRQLYADRYLPELSRLLRHEMTVSQLQSSTERSKKILMIIDAYKKIPIERQLQEHPIASPPSIALPAFDGSGPVQQLKEPKGPNPTTRPQPQVTRSIETPTTVSAPINRPGSAPSTRPLRWQTPLGPMSSRPPINPTPIPSTVFLPSMAQMPYPPPYGQQQSPPFPPAQHRSPQHLHWQTHQGHMQGYHPGPIASDQAPPNYHGPFQNHGPGQIQATTPNLQRVSQENGRNQRVVPSQYVYPSEALGPAPPQAPIAGRGLPQMPPVQPLPFRRPFLPPEAHRAPQTFNGDPMRIGLHQAHLRDPVKKLGQFGVSGAWTELALYQYFDGFKVSPKILDPEKLQHSWKFTIRNDDLLRFPRKEALGYGQPPVFTYQAGCHTLRLRSISLPLSQEEEELAQSWPNRNTAWPSVLYILLNGHEITARRKLYNGKDLPLDLSTYVKQGENDLVIKLLLDKNECQNMRYAFAVEIMKIEQFEKIRSMVQTITADEVRYKIQQRLNPSTDDDDLAVVTDSLTIGLIDPFTAQVFKDPARSINCNHLECFDLDTYIKTRKSESGPGPMMDNWRCPICSSDARPHQLVLDAFLAAIREELRRNNQLETAQAIQYSLDGTWTVKTPSEEPSSGKGSQPLKRKISQITGSPTASPNSRVRTDKSPAASSEIEVIELD